MSIKNKVQEHARQAISKRKLYYFFNEVCQYYDMYEKAHSKYYPLYHSRVLKEFLEQEGYGYSSVSQFRLLLTTNKYQYLIDSDLRAMNGNNHIYFLKDIKAYARKKKLKEIRNQLDE